MSDYAGRMWDTLLTPLPENDPFEHAAYRVRQGARPEGGRREGALTQALSDPATIFNVSPFGLARDALHSVNEGNYGRAAMDVAPFVAGPVLGPALRAGSRVVAAAPRATAGAMGTMGALAAADAGERDPANPEWWRSKREAPPAISPFAEPTLTPEEEARYTAPEIQGFDKLGPMGKLKATEQRGVAQAKLLEDRKAALGEKTTRARADWDANRQRIQDAYEAEQARLDAEDQKFREANQSFREAHPDLATALQFAGAGTAAGFPLLARGLRLRANNKVLGQLDDAIAAGETARAVPRNVPGALSDRIGAAERLRGAIGPQGVGRIKDTELSLPAQAAWATGGALEGALGSEIPYIVDVESLPSESHGRTEANDWANWLSRAAYGAIPAGMAGFMGARVPMSKGAVPDIPRAEGLIKGLEYKERAPRAPRKPSADAANPAEAKPRRTRKKPAPAESD